MAENCSIIYNRRGSSTKTEVVTTPQSFSVLWNISMDSMSCIGMCHIPISVSIGREVYENGLAHMVCTHSDLKPENILLDYTGHIALCDFGESFFIKEYHSITEDTDWYSSYFAYGQSFFLGTSIYGR